MSTSKNRSSTTTQSQSTVNANPNVTESTMSTTSSTDSNASGATGATGASNAGSTTTPAPLTPDQVLFVNAPPPTAVIPSPPPGFKKPKGAQYRGIKPNKSEASNIGDAVQEIRSFSDFSARLGNSVPTQDEVVQLFDAASQWTTMRTESEAWDAYASNEEGIIWTGVRQVMTILKPAYELALTVDPMLATKYPKLTTFLGAKKAVAKKAVSTKAMNNEAVAKGEPPTHGVVGKKRKAAAIKAIVAAHDAAQAAAAEQPAAGKSGGTTNAQQSGVGAAATGGSANGAAVSGSANGGAVNGSAGGGAGTNGAAHA